MNSTTAYPTAVVSVPPTHNSNLETLLVIGMALLFVLFCSGTSVLVSYYRRRATRARTQSPALRWVDLERQAHFNGVADAKNGSHNLAFPPVAVLARSWSASTSDSQGLGKLSMELPPPVLAVAPSSRLRDSVLCKALSQLTWPVPDKTRVKNSKASSRRIIDIEAAAADKVNQSSGVSSLASDSSLNYPEWVRPHLADFREHSKHKWTLYTPSTPVTVPKIVIESCDEDNEPAFDTPGSTYSTDSAPSEMDTPPPMTPTPASPASFYFPASPSFSIKDCLQVPLPSFHAPRDEDRPVMRNVSNFSGRTFSLAAAPAFSNKKGSLRDRRMLARTQAGNVVNTHSLISNTPTRTTGPGNVKECGSGPRAPQGLTGSAIAIAQAAAAGMTGVGLGLNFRPQQDFRVSHDKALSVSAPYDNISAHSLPTTFRTAGYWGPNNVLESPSSNVVLASAITRQHDSNIGSAPLVNTITYLGVPADVGVDVEGRSKHAARLVRAFESSCSLASLDNDGGDGKLRDILGLGDYHYDHYDESLDNADADNSAVTEVFVTETAARRAVVGHAF
ncbi:hypothetical protein C2E23DRAFT_859854 [Lenzites betulinus]|nr:hypothetical protein C2E23DRAFT_859854 [Lenzites betulinus]